MNRHTDMSVRLDPVNPGYAGTVMSVSVIRSTPGQPLCRHLAPARGLPPDTLAHFFWKARVWALFAIKEKDKYFENFGVLEMEEKIEVQISEDPNPNPNFGFVKENFIGPKFRM